MLVHRKLRLGNDGICMPPPDDQPPMSLDRINRMDRAEFVAALGGLVEHSPWVAEQVFDRRPFASVWSLHGAMVGCLRQASRQRQIALVCLHPELAGQEVAEGTLTASSNAEQARLGLLTLSRADHQRLATLNADYRARFGFPFVTAVRRHADLTSVFDAFERRLGHDAVAELAENLGEIGEVLRGRLARLFGTPMGWLSTHVLDNVSGGPAAGMAFDIAVQDGHAWQPVGRGIINAQGRTDEPVLVDHAMARKVYQFEFEVGGYYRARGVPQAELPFLDRVPLRFGIDDPDSHYHVPLLCTPWTYSTYRGS